MSRIEVVPKEGEEGRGKIKEDVKVSKVRVMAEVFSLKGAIKHIQSSDFIFNIDPHADIAAFDLPVTDLP